MTMRGRALFLGVVMLTSASARAQTAPLPPVPELKLKLPVTPLQFSFQGAEVGSYQNLPGGALPLYRAEALWLRTGALRLVTFGAAERAWELDCRLVCQPVVQSVLAVEARFALPSPHPALQETHAFLRFSSARTPIVNSTAGVVHAGIAGAF